MILSLPRLALAAVLSLLPGSLPTAALARFAGSAAAGPDHAAFQRITTLCRGKDDFSDPAPPARITGNVYYVGTCNVTALLVTSPRGHVLIDAPTQEAVPAILANIRALGLRERDVRWILVSHEHFDHVGGLALIARATRAEVIARAAQVPALASGKVDPADPQAQGIHGFLPVRVGRVVADGQPLRLAGTTFIPTATPGHTTGSTSWTWQSCTGGRCQRIDYVDSLSALALGTYRLSDHPALVARFRATFAQVAARPCGLLLTPHPVASDMFARLSGVKPLATPNDCRTYAAQAGKRLDDLLAGEASR